MKDLKEGKKTENSDYQNFKLSADNLGFKLLKKLGWEEGKGEKIIF
jgi:splicing factor 4